MTILDERNSLNIKNSAYNKKNGRYVMGGSTEVSVNTLEWWNRTIVKQDPSDLVYFMEKKYEGRPDILGVVFYGDPGLWWIITQYNSVLDPMNELVEGRILLIPTMERVKQSFSVSSVGGIPTTRI